MQYELQSIVSILLLVLLQVDIHEPIIHLPLFETSLFECSS